MSANGKTLNEINMFFTKSLSPQFLRLIGIINHTHIDVNSELPLILMEWIILRLSPTDPCYRNSITNKYACNCSSRLKILNARF